MGPSHHALQMIAQLIRGASRNAIKTPKILPGRSFVEHAEIWEVIGITEICGRLSTMLGETVSPEDHPYDVATKTQMKFDILKRLAQKPSIMDDLIERLGNESREEWID